VVGVAIEISLPCGMTTLPFFLRGLTDFFKPIDSAANQSAF
jgi:hypothetical protein